jgi:prevent-host-death family protein
MMPAPSRELRDSLGRYLSLVGKGETIIVTDRGKPVARLVPPSPKRVEPVGLEEVLRQLEAEGHLRRGSGRYAKFKPVRIKGKPASQMIFGRPRLMLYGDRRPC